MYMSPRGAVHDPVNTIRVNSGDENVALVQNDLNTPPHHCTSLFNYEAVWVLALPFICSDDVIRPEAIIAILGSHSDSIHCEHSKCATNIGLKTTNRKTNRNKGERTNEKTPNGYKLYKTDQNCKSWNKRAKGNEHDTLRMVR